MPHESPKNKPSAPRKNQDVLDFIESIRRDLGDANPKSFGLYMKLFKEHGRQKMETALYLTKRNTVLQNEGKIRYFLAILLRKRFEKESRKEYKEQKERRKQTEAGALYEEMKAHLLKRMTPQYQRRASVRSRLMHKVAKQERKARA